MGLGKDWCNRVQQRIQLLQEGLVHLSDIRMIHHMCEYLGAIQLCVLLIRVGVLMGLSPKSLLVLK